jgi:hypothetical protein
MAAPVIPAYANGQLGYLIDSTPDDTTFKANLLFYVIFGQFDATDLSVRNNLIEIPV